MVSYLGSGRSQSARRKYLEVEGQATIAVSTITQAEVLSGLEKRPEATRLRLTYDKFFGSVAVLPFDSAAAYGYGKLCAQTSAVGVGIALMDLLIAAHAFALGATLVSHDKVFQRLTPLLLVVDWAADLQ